MRVSELFVQCGALFSGAGPLWLVFLLGGLVGGFTHCVAMCGPLVACQNLCGGQCGKQSDLRAATQYPYHLGRMLTYGALGFAAAVVAKQLTTFAFWPKLSAAMLVLAGLAFVLSSLPQCRHWLGRLPLVRSVFLRGALMGFMPCGLIYAALMVAATTANPLAAMALMWLFVLGTLPALLLASAGTALLPMRWQPKLEPLGRAIMALNGVALFILAGKLVR